MSNLAEVRLWGRKIGAVSLHDGICNFEYAPSFRRSNIEVSPLMMPLSDRVYSFPSLSKRSFHGLPGLLADSLPDKFGTALIDAWLARQGRLPESFNVIERLCYTGDRGMGGLEYHPTLGPKAQTSKRIELDALADLASEILQNRKNFKTSFDSKEDAMKDILHVGTSAGGARAKAVIAWNPRTDEIRSGQIETGEGFEYWLLKFDGVSENKDKELTDPKGYSAIEYAYYLMALDAGIHMSECRLLEENDRRHFMTRRFDRLEGGQKLHMQSLAALAHYDFNDAGAHSYEQAFFAIKQLGLGRDAIEQQFRRMVFNILARNQDDHVKNIAFLMDKSGRWFLAPAYDVTYSYNPHGAWTARHQMSMNGKRDGFNREDFRSAAEVAALKKGRADKIVDETSQVVKEWPTYATAAGVTQEHTEQIQHSLRLEIRDP